MSTQEQSFIRGRGIVVAVLKLAVSMGLVIWLFNRIQRSNPDAFVRLLQGPHHVPLLLAAVVCGFGVLATHMLRWRYLVHALGIRMRLADVIRWGFWGYILDMVGIGLLGGDVVRALLAARRTGQARSLMLTTVAVDRYVGLVVTLLIAAVGAGLVAHTNAGPELASLKRTVWVVAAAGLAAGPMLMLAGETMLRLLKLNPLTLRIHAAVDPFVAGTRLYGRRPGVLVKAALLTLLPISFTVMTAHCIALALPGGSPTLLQQYVVLPLVQLASVLPLPLEALGVFDAAMSFLYDIVTAGVAPQDKGLLVALAFHCVSILIGAVGLVVYSTRRGEIPEVLKSKEDLSESESPGG